MSIKTYDLSLTKTETDVFSIEGPCEILISGATPCTIMRSVGDSGFFPMTDDEGNELFYPATNSSSVILNTTLTNESRGCKFKVALDKAALSENTDVSVTISQGW